jgi:hypothetical protein
VQVGGDRREGSGRTRCRGKEGCAGVGGIYQRDVLRHIVQQRYAFYTRKDGSLRHRQCVLRSSVHGLNYHEARLAEALASGHG